MSKNKAEKKARVLGLAEKQNLLEAAGRTYFQNTRIQTEEVRVSGANGDVEIRLRTGRTVDLKDAGFIQSRIDGFFASLRDLLPNFDPDMQPVKINHSTEMYNSDDHWIILRFNVGEED